MGGPKEIELKLEIEPDDVPRLEAHGALEAAAATREIQTLSAVYFDTEALDLAASRVTLRVRQEGGRSIQAIKALGDNLFDRDEWESELDGESPDLARAEGTALEPLLKNGLESRLKPVFVTRIRRTVYRIAQDGSAIELALDQGTIEAGERRVPVCEVELELKQGEIGDLFRLARSLIETVPLRLSIKSKPERGYDLLRKGEIAAAEKARDVSLDPTLPSSEAFKIVARICLRQLLANVPAMRARNAEGLHQMRIGLRRLRAAISLFAPLFAQTRTEIKQELKWMTQQLGPARDLDVLIMHVSDRKGKDASQQDEAERRLSQLQPKREQAYDEAAAMSSSQRLCFGLIDLAEWIEIGEGVAKQEQPIAEFAAGVLARRRKRVRKRGEKLDELSVKQRHKLRIQAKKLRYGIEFFASLFPGKTNDERRSTALTALKDLQDQLGELNDIAMRQQLLAEGDESGAELAVDAQETAETQQDRVNKLIEQAKRTHAAFAGVKAFWKA